MSEKLSERNGPKIVILGSLKNGDYIITAPRKVREDYHNEEGYQEACKRFYPAIDEADVIIVYGDVGEHTQRDIDYAISKGKKIIRLDKIEALEDDKRALTEIRKWFQNLICKKCIHPERSCICEVAGKTMPYRLIHPPPRVTDDE
jgi:uncharacterized protein YgbK (DUF1537 family)